jgi:hypothetical protein
MIFLHDGMVSLTVHFLQERDTAYTFGLVGKLRY